MTSEETKSAASEYAAMIVDAAEKAGWKLARESTSFLSEAVYLKLAREVEVVESGETYIEEEYVTVRVAAHAAGGSRYGHEAANYRVRLDWLSMHGQSFADQTKALAVALGVEKIA